MATETENYNLTMPADDDLYDIADFNGNMEIIDLTMAQVATQTDGFSDTLDQIVEYIGTPNEEGDTLFDHFEYPETTYYRASENYKYAYTNNSGFTFSSGANLIFRFTAKYNGTVNFALNTAGNYQSIICVLENHQNNYWEVPSLSSSTTYTTYLSDNSMAVQYNTTSASDKKFVLDVIAGHQYLFVQEVSGYIYSIKIGYDLITTDDIVETDLDPV